MGQRMAMGQQSRRSTGFTIVGRIKHHRRGLVAALAASLTLAGCAGLTDAPRMGIASAQLAQTASIPEIPGARIWGDFVPRDVATAIKTTFPDLPPIGASATREEGRPVIDILALSGGGGDGAFGAGLLSGWSQAGTRPEFELVTGISAGALIAPFAFLGPAYDAPLRAIWTKFKTKELITPRGVAGFLTGDALTDTKPLARLIERFVDRDMLAAIAREYWRGRVLLVLTTNLDAQRPVVWNMGAIANSPHPEAPALFRSVLLASAAIPGVFPPVRIQVTAEDGQTYDELHVDGGITADVFISPLPVDLTAFDALYPVKPKRRIYVIKNSRVAPTQSVTTQRAIAIAGRSISTVLLSQGDGTLYRIYRRAQDAGAEFHFAAIPTPFRLVPREAFDTSYQSALFELAQDMARGGYPWSRVPPSLVPTADRPSPPERFKPARRLPGDEGRFEHGSFFDSLLR